MRKPFFKRQDKDKKKRLKPVWRRPKGIHSKQRIFQSKGKKPRIGFKKKVVNQERQPVVIKNINQLLSLKDSDKVILASGIGLKKKIWIIKKALDRGITVLNHDLGSLQKRFETLKVERMKKRKFKEKSKAKERAKEKKKLEEEIKLQEAEKKHETEKRLGLKSEEKEIKAVGTKPEKREEKREEKPEDKKLQEKIEKEKILKKRV